MRNYRKLGKTESACDYWLLKMSPLESSEGFVLVALTRILLWTAVSNEMYIAGGNIKRNSLYL